MATIPLLSERFVLACILFRGDHCHATITSCQSKHLAQTHYTLIPRNALSTALFYDKVTICREFRLIDMVERNSFAITRRCTLLMWEALFRSQTTQLYSQTASYFATLIIWDSLEATSPKYSTWEFKHFITVYRKKN